MAFALIHAVTISLANKSSLAVHQPSINFNGRLKNDHAKGNTSVGVVYVGVVRLSVEMFEWRVELVGL